MIAGWSSLVARRAHNPKVIGSNPVPATKANSGLSQDFLEKALFLCATYATLPAVYCILILLGLGVTVAIILIFAQGLLMDTEGCCLFRFAGTFTMATRFFFLPIFFVLFWVSPLLATTEPLIGDIIITSSQQELLLFATAKNAFTEEMLEGVHNGIPITFRFYIRLYRTRSAWFNESIIRHVINHTLTYDPIKQEYQVAFAERDRPERTRSLQEAKQMMSELNGLEIIPLENLQPGIPYALHIKATLVENIFPLGLHSLIPFVSLWNFQTDWRIVEFKY